MEKLKLTSTVFGPKGKITFFVYSFILSPDRLLYKLHVLQLYQQWMYLGQDISYHLVLNLDWLLYLSNQSQHEIYPSTRSGRPIYIHSCLWQIIHRYLAVVANFTSFCCQHLIFNEEYMLQAGVFFCPSEVSTCAWSPDKVIQ